jgi:hypothetical protein
MLRHLMRQPQLSRVIVSDAVGNQEVLSMAGETSSKLHVFSWEKNGLTQRLIERRHGFVHTTVLRVRRQHAYCKRA